MNPTLFAGLVAATALGLVFNPVTAGGLPEGYVSRTPDQLEWRPSPRVTGLENAALIGSSKEAGPYVERVRFPPNFVVQPHTHPEERTYTILSGTWYIGWGEEFDESKLQALPAGSFYVEPPGKPHFVATKDEAVIFQLSGMGPTATSFVDPSHAPKPQQ